MVVNKRKKNSRQRGNWTHGWGAKKKRRGTGHRGGKGNAGTGKRSDSNKPSIWQNTKYFGKHGFKKKGIKRDIKAINIKDIRNKLELYLNEKLIAKEGEFYVIDLEKIGFNKLLGSGKIDYKLKIKAPYASKKAGEKIKKAGGELILSADKKVENK